MSFSKQTKGRELSYFMRLVNVFGAVEYQQMRQLFKHLNDAEFGRVYYRLYREGQIYCPKDGGIIAVSKLALEKTNLEDSIACFWVFISMKNAVRDFCPSEPPAIATITTESKTVDIIPVRDDNVEEINEHIEDAPVDTMRFLVASDIKNIIRIDRRIRNDTFVLVDHTGNVECYEL